MNDVATREMEMARTAKQAEEVLELRSHLNDTKGIMDKAMRLLDEVLLDDEMDATKKITVIGQVIKMGSGVVNTIKNLNEIKQLTKVDADGVKVRLHRTVLLGKRLLNNEDDYQKYIEGMDEIWSSL